MKLILWFGTCAASLLALEDGFCAEASSRVENFNLDWRFMRGQQPGAELPGFNDSSWGQVRLPHDWAIEGPHQPEGDPNTGKLPWRGEGWYRRHFLLPATDTGKRVYLDFDGVMAMPSVFVNGKRAGGWDYGYVSFRVDATDFVRFGETNVVAVHVDTRPHNSRWYPGAGIYRKVQLSINEPVHIAHWGTFVTTPVVERKSADVKVQVSLENHRTQEAQVELETLVLAPGGKTVGTKKQKVSIPASGQMTAVQDFQIKDPRLWDIEEPLLYSVVNRLSGQGRLLEQSETPFGIRFFEFSANDGFHLNGRRVQLKGVNLHHDHGPLGAAFFTRAMERQLEIMKDMGVNAIRTSHNPPAPELLDLCDRMGLVVWDEAFDKWDSTSTRPRGISIPEYNRKQIQNLVLRDRNHPSVILWSAGNEIWDLEGLKLPDSPGLLRQMVGFFKEFDPTRPVTLAHAVPESARSPLDDALDVTGWNYARRYAISREVRPQLPIVYSESASALSTRGHYELPHASRKDAFSPSLRLSSYDHNSASWSDLADTEFALMDKDSFVAGEFVWTGFDYLGEPTPFIARGWGSFKARAITPEEESRSSLFGIVDLAGIPKDRYFLYRSYWAPEKKTIHILPHWNWPDRAGMKVPVYVYTSGDSAELFLNGTSLGKRAKDPKAENVMDRYRLRWEDVVYQAGEVKAVAYQGRRKLGEAVMRTAGAPAKLKLTPDRDTLRADGDDLCYVLVEAQDSTGTLCPLATNIVQFAVFGPATIAGVANGDHHFPAEYKANHVSLFYGKAMLVVRTEDDGRAGNIRIAARASELEPTLVTVRSRITKR